RRWRRGETQPFRAWKERPACAFERFNECVAQGREARRSPGPSIVDIERRPGVTSPATFVRIVPHPPSR
ncbi:MAG: hypothetical protein WBS14_00615, partial [Rhodomicrobium sp.]